MDPRDKKPAEASAVVIRHSEMPNLILHGKRSDSGQWSIPGGHVHIGENIKNAAVREIKEETGLELNPDDLEHIGTEHYDKPEKNLTVHLFLCKKPYHHESMDFTEDKDKEFEELKFIDPLTHDNLYQPNGENILVTYLKGSLKKPEIKKAEQLDKGKVINPTEIPKVAEDSDEYFSGISYAGEDEALKNAASKGKHLHLPLTQKNLQRFHLFHNETLDDHMDKDTKDFAMKNPELARKYPIVIARHSNGSLHVTDGQHRFNQAIKDNKTHVKAFVFNVPKHYEDQIYAPNHIGKYYPQFKKSEELDKDQGRIAFKKLKVPSRPDQEVRELTTPRQFEITSRHFANKYNPKKSTAQKKMDAAQLQYNIENDIGGTITNEEGKFSTPFMNTNVEFNSKRVDPNFIKEHEGFHHLMNTVREKYGHENAGNILNSLISHIHPEDVKNIENSLIQRNYKKKNHPLAEQLWNEEIINHVRDFVHFSGARKGFSEESGARIKSAWKKMQRAAKNINIPLNTQQPKKLAASEKLKNNSFASLTKSNKPKKAKNLRRFYLNRKNDVSGVSGEGVVAVGVQFPNGKCVLNWVTDTPSFNFYNSINDIKDIHGHGDSTEIHFMDELNKSEKEKKLQKAYENKRLKWKYLRKFPEHKLPFIFLKSKIE